MTLEELDILAKKHYYNLELMDSLRCYAAVFTEFPYLALAYNNYGNIMREMGHPKVAFGFLQNAINLDPDNKDYPFNLAIAHLINEDLPEAWDKFESRWKFKQHEHCLLGYNSPRWEGQDLNGKRLLVTCEEGDGDNLQFSMLTEYLEKQGCHVIHQTEPNIQRLFQNSFKNATVITNKEEPPEYDYWTPILSIPRVIRMTYDNMPKVKNYLKADKKLVNFWKKELGEKTKPRIGFCWGGRTKQYPFEEMYKLIKNNPQYHWVSLQGSAEQDQIRLLDNEGVTFHFDKITDWYDTAGLVANLDMVIAVDTGLIHLAGGMGKSSCLLLDFYSTCWRWRLDLEDTIWYPSVKLFRQKEVRGFNEQLERVEDYLAKKIGAEAP
jgi:hypothetical protein